MKNNVNTDTLRFLLRLTEEELHDFLSTQLKKYYKNVITSQAYILAEGTIPICLVAHLDTVFENQKKDIITINNIITTKNQGLGADDRAGVYMILKILEKGFRPHVIFTLGEEKNARGAFSIIKKYNYFPFDIKFFIELDRKGRNECVFYDCHNSAFQKYIESFGYIRNSGTYTDIRVLCPAWGIAGVNVSCGYYHEHTLKEYLNLTDLDYSLNKVIKILESYEDIPKFSF